MEWDDLSEESLDDEWDWDLVEWDEEDILVPVWTESKQVDLTAFDG